MQKQVLVAGSLLPLLAHSLWAQRRNDAEGAVAAAGCAVCGSLIILIPIAFFAVNIALLVWVARDAKARGMDGAVVWMILVMFTSIIGLTIFILSRPKGDLVPCPHCHNKRLQASVKCPHCGNA